MSAEVRVCLQPTTYNLQPATYNLQPYNLQPATYNLQPTTYYLLPTTDNYVGDEMEFFPYLEIFLFSGHPWGQQGVIRVKICSFA